MNSILKNKNGFTLVELLVSVAIIGLIASIAIPHIKDFRQRAKLVVANARARSLLFTAETWINDVWDETPSGTAASDWHIAWRLNSSGSDFFVKGGEIFKQMNPNTLDEGFSSYIRIDADEECLVRGTNCLNGVKYTAFVIVCDFKDSENTKVFSYSRMSDGSLSGNTGSLLNDGTGAGYIGGYCV